MNVDMWSFPFTAMALSIYSDLKDVPKAFIPARQCRPWFHRTDHPTFDTQNGTTLQVREFKSASTFIHMLTKQTKQGKVQIEALMDQPGTCIRDEVDKVDFKELEWTRFERN